MASNFHERLVQARREGTAPTPSDTSAPSSVPLPTYTPVPAGTPDEAHMSCNTCGASVVAWKTPDHTAWHLASGH